MSLADDAGELASATRLFAQRHEEALLSGDPKRVTEACDGLHHGVCATLATEMARLHRGVAMDGALPSVHELRAGAPGAREAWAYASATKRLAETEGVLMHLKLTLAKGADGPAGGLWWRRLVGESVLAARCSSALVASVDAWAAALGAHVPTRQATARDALRAARETLLLGVPQAAIPALRLALAELPREKAAEMSAALDAAGADVVEAWRWLDVIENAVNVAGMTPPAALPRV